MATYRLKIAYDGAEFRGWARQSCERTVQGELETALSQLFDGPVELIVAGRTDAGAHATAQVASFTAEKEPPPTLLRALNSLTPEDIAVLAIEKIAGGFNARRDAVSRRYRYRVETSSVKDPFERRLAFWFPYPLDRGALDACASAIVGKHDFTAFTPTDAKYVHVHRTVMDAGWSEESEALLVFEIEADAFMRNMVRALVGTMLEVSTGRRSLAEFEALLVGATRAHAGETAPAHGLYLVGVRY